ncbi:MULTISPECIES: SapC family protein [unclassified Halomonas]|uniref:SapC family protein n=1 Tax=unclassified Halomonas TaxID=2609666 RepID=UPI002076710B|nr:MULTISPECIES: SapC family protein [unclassified Halomonas]
MSSFAPLSFSEFQNKRWLNTPDFNFVSTQSAIALVAQELPHAIPTMPVGFRKLEDGRYELVAICALGNERNLFVHADGRWLASYKPALLRSYPFLTQYDNAQNRHVLCVDESSGLVIDDASQQGTPFFDDTGKPSEQLTKIKEFLTRWQKQRAVIQKAVDMLSSLGVIVPWTLHIKQHNGETISALDGFYRVDEAVLNALSSQKIQALRQVNALPVAYAQLFSQHRIAVLTRLNSMHAKNTDTPFSESDVDSLFKEGDDDFTFDFDS